MDETDVVVVGAGFAGLYALYRLRELGLRVRVFEVADGVGGTWHWNRYPGARCDVESFDYSYSFSPELEREWTWSERYPAQPELLRYLNHVADRFDLRRDISLSTRVEAAVYDDTSGRWIVTTDRGQELSAAYCVMATGMLSSSQIPSLPGLDAFEGATYHTGRWPADIVDFRDRRVGVIGTGSSGIQAIPEIAAQAGHLTVFQRTAHFSIPARNGPLDPAVHDEVTRTYPARRARARMSHIGKIQDINLEPVHSVSEAERDAEYERRWAFGGADFMGAFGDLLHNEEANATAAEFVRRKIRELVADPDVAELLCPRDFPIGTKRICVDTDYYVTFNRPNVSLVDVKAAPIVEFTASGIRTARAEYPLDMVVFATGFDAMTGALMGMDIRGRGGLQLREKWSAGPRTYLGLATAGFPNLFIITGPGSPSVLSNMVNSIEQHVEWITDLVAHLERHGIQAIEPTIDAEDNWVEHVNYLATRTLYERANSWFLGANIPGKPRVFMPYLGGAGRYRAACDRIARDGYPGFRMSAGEGLDSRARPHMTSPRTLAHAPSFPADPSEQHDEL